jgi:hypothetical protein
MAGSAFGSGHGTFGRTSVTTYWRTEPSDIWMLTPAPSWTFQSGLKSVSAAWAKMYELLFCPGCELP